MPKSGPATRTVAPAASGWLSTNPGSARQAANRPSPKPVRVTRLRYSAGMIWSVSTLARRNDTARPVCVMNGCKALLLLQITRSQVGRGGEPAGHRGGGGDLRRDQVGAGALALAALEVPVGRGRAALAGRQLVRVHAQAHGAASGPPLGAGGGEHLGQPLALGGSLDLHRAGHD